MFKWQNTTITYLESEIEKLTRRRYRRQVKREKFLKNILFQLEQAIELAETGTVQNPSNFINNSFIKKHCPDGDIRAVYKRLKREQNWSHYSISH